MTRTFTLVCASILFFSCGTRINYLGSSNAPTQKVDVFVDPSSISKPYKIMGKGYVNLNVYAKKSIERSQEKALVLAREKGADAILFQDQYFLQQNPTVVSTIRTDSLKLTTSQPAGQVVASRIDVLFLKYQ
jgi:hypothetical protein